MIFMKKVGNKMTRYPIFTKTGTDLYSDQDQFLGKGYFKSDVKYEKGKQIFYILSYSDIITTAPTFESAKRKAKDYAEKKGSKVIILKMVGKYTPEW